MNNFELPTGRQFERLRESFAEMEEIEAMLRPVADSAPKSRISASKLYAAAGGSGAELNSQVDALLAENRAARAFYRDALAASAPFAFPEAMAASSGAPSARYGEGCNIRIERSRAEPDQFFVVVEITGEIEASAQPASLIVCDNEDRCQRFPLPALRDGIAQIIADSDSDLMRLLSDPTTRAYLR